MAITVKQIPGFWQALGLASHYLAKKEPFCHFPAGDLIRTVTGQIQRGHYLFALDTASEPAKVIGYFGWVLYSHANADNYAATGIPPVADISESNDVLWLLTAASDNRAAFFNLVKATRKHYPHQRIMGIRHKKSGQRAVFDQWRKRIYAAKQSS